MKNNRTNEWIKMHKNPKDSGTYVHISLSKMNQLEKIMKEIDFQKYVDLKDTNGVSKGVNVIEFGPADGGLCKLMINHLNINRYVLVDDSKVLSLAKENLSEELEKGNEIQFVNIEDIESIEGSFNLFISCNCMTETPYEYQENVYDLFLDRCDEIFISDRWEGYKFERNCNRFHELLLEKLNKTHEKIRKCGQLDGDRPGQWIIHSETLKQK